MSLSRILSLPLPLLVVAAALAAPAIASADVLYSQPYLATTNGAYLASVQGGYSQYDTFSLTADGTIGSVSWSGFDANQLLQPGSPINPASFEVDIYAESRSGKPGALLSTTTIGNSGNAVATSQIFQGVFTLYDYSGTFAAPFQAAAGTTYWIAVTDPTSNDNWYWATGAGPDGSHFEKIPVAGSQTISDDLAFTLSSVAAVPEPASYALFLLGGAGLLGAQALRRGSRREG